MRRRRMRTTIIALSLILAMIGGLLPSAMFPAAAAGSKSPISDVRSTQIRALQYAGADKSVTYDFWNGITSKENIRLLKEYDANKNTNWKFHSDLNGGTFQGYYGTLRFGGSTNTSVADTWLAFQIQSPDAGKYTATFGYKYHACLLYTSPR